MKYLRKKSDSVITLPDSGHHSDHASKSEVKSAGRFRRSKDGKVVTYGKSHGFNVYPRKGDAALIQKKLNG